MELPEGRGRQQAGKWLTFEELTGKVGKSFSNVWRRKRARKKAVWTFVTAPCFFVSSLPVICRARD
jgi:hypothetical protein